MAVFVVQGSKKSFEFFTVERKPQYELAIDKLKKNEAYSVVGQYSYGHTTFSNLIMISQTNLPSLWTNAFISPLSHDERLNRFALYGKLVGWSKDDFMGFMTPNKAFLDRSGNKVFSTEPIFGLGHWLLFNKVSQKIKEKDYLKRLSIIYDKEIEDQLLEMGIK